MMTLAASARGTTAHLGNSTAHNSTVQLVHSQQEAPPPAHSCLAHDQGADLTVDVVSALALVSSASEALVPMAVVLPPSFRLDTRKNMQSKFGLTCLQFQRNKSN